MANEDHSREVELMHILSAVLEDMIAPFVKNSQIKIVYLLSVRMNVEKSGNGEKTRDLKSW
jgi:hypothetical protein